MLVKRLTHLAIAAGLSHRDFLHLPELALRVLLVDSHPVVRQGLKSVLADLDREIDFYEANDCARALALAVGGPAMDLILLELRLPDGHGIDTLRVIREGFGAAVVVVVSGEDDSHVVRLAIENGAAGFVPKASTPQLLIAALRLVLAGGIYLPLHILHDCPSSLLAPSENLASPSLPNIGGLSARQLEVLLHAVHGKANKVIARELKLSEGTVKAHLSAAFRALNVHNRTEAVFVAASLGLRDVH